MGNQGSAPHEPLARAAATNAGFTLRVMDPYRTGFYLFIFFFFYISLYVHTVVWLRIIALRIQIPIVCVVIRGVVITVTLCIPKVLNKIESMRVHVLKEVLCLSVCLVLSAYVLECIGGFVHRLCSSLTLKLGFKF